MQPFTVPMILAEASTAVPAWVTGMFGLLLILMIAALAFEENQRGSPACSVCC